MTTLNITWDRGVASCGKEHHQLVCPELSRALSSFGPLAVIWVYPSGSLIRLRRLAPPSGTPWALHEEPDLETAKRNAESWARRAYARAVRARREREEGSQRFSRVDPFALRPAEFAGERADCSVRALAIAAAISYSEAHRAFTVAGRKRGEGTFIGHTAVAHHFYRGQHEPALGPGLAAHQRRYPTLAAWVLAHPKGRWVVHVRQHAFAVVDGVVHDTAPAMRRRVIRAWRFDNPAVASE
jgi:hypothetical protein